MIASGVLVFRVALDALAREVFDRYTAWLSAEEREKSERMATPRLKDEFVATRALCRWVLSKNEPAVRPEDWRFDRTEAGRPFVVGRSAPSFNLSHAGGLVVCALSSSPVGVDVEALSRGVELVGTATRMFSPAENAALMALPENERPRRAVELWTTKEAYVKARGEGISVRLTKFGVVAEGPRYRLEDVSIFGEAPEEWQIDVQEVPGEAEPCVIAVAVRRRRAADVVVEHRLVVPG